MIAQNPTNFAALVYERAISNGDWKDVPVTRLTVNAINSLIAVARLWNDNEKRVFDSIFSRDTNFDESELIYHALLGKTSHKSVSGGGVMKGYGIYGHKIEKQDLILPELQEGLSEGLFVISGLKALLVAKNHDHSSIDISHQMARLDTESERRPRNKFVALGRPTLIDIKFPLVPRLEPLESTEDVVTRVTDYSTEPVKEHEVENSIHLFTDPTRMDDIKSVNQLLWPNLGVKV